MEKPTCGTCDYWGPVDDAGYCHRHAEGYAGDCQNTKCTSVGWCGEHPDFEAWMKQENADNDSCLRGALREVHGLTSLAHKMAIMGGPARADYPFATVLHIIDAALEEKADDK